MQNMTMKSQLFLIISDIVINNIFFCLNILQFIRVRHKVRWEWGCMNDYRQQWSGRWRICRTGWRPRPQRGSLRCWPLRTTRRKPENGEKCKIESEKVSKLLDAKHLDNQPLPSFRSSIGHTRITIWTCFSNTWALEILGTQSMPKAVRFFWPRALIRSGFCPGYRNEYRIPSSLRVEGTGYREKGKETSTK